MEHFSCFFTKKPRQLQLPRLEVAGTSGNPFYSKMVGIYGHIGDYVNENQIWKEG